MRPDRVVAVKLDQFPSDAAGFGELFGRKLIRYARDASFGRVAQWCVCVLATLATSILEIFPLAMRRASGSVLATVLIAVISGGDDPDCSTWEPLLGSDSIFTCKIVCSAFGGNREILF
jgi:hypothetical protein